MLKCYNCSAELTEETKTREHIPAQNLFGGYSDEYKKNRIVVPACIKCNNLYSKIDQEMRDFIGMINFRRNEVTQKSIKSITRRPNWSERVNFVDGKLNYIDFNYSELRALHIKNFKGIFYHKYGFPLPNNYDVEIITEFDKDEELIGIAQILYNYVTYNKNWMKSGHKDIFYFNMRMMSITEDKKNVTDDANLDNAISVIAILVYHNFLYCIVIGAKKDYLEQILNK